MPTAREILNSIENRLRDLHEEIETLTAARAALRPGHPRPPERPRSSIVAPNGRPAARNPSGKRLAKSVPRAQDGQSETRPRSAPRLNRQTRQPTARRPVKGLNAAGVELLLTGTSALSTSELAKRANCGRDRVLVLLRELEAGGQVRRTGQRRGTRWHVVTDEDRIAQRAAELTARSKRK